MRDTCFHLDQFLETPTNTSYNQSLKDAYTKIFKKYIEKLTELGLDQSKIDDASNNMQQEFMERFAIMYNKSVTSFQVGNKIESFLSLFMSYLGSNPFYKIDGLFKDKFMNLKKFKELFYEYRMAESDDQTASLPVTLNYFFQMKNDRKKLI